VEWEEWALEEVEEEVILDLLSGLVEIIHYFNNRISLHFTA
jgi:hypothetical protein